jgi:hypothetical protein
VKAAPDSAVRSADMPDAKTFFISSGSELACPAGQAPCPPAPRERRSAAAEMAGVVPVVQPIRKVNGPLGQWRAEPRADVRPRALASGLGNEVSGRLLQPRLA